MKIGQKLRTKKGILTIIGQKYSPVHHKVLWYGKDKKLQEHYITDDILPEEKKEEKEEIDLKKIAEAIHVSKGDKGEKGDPGKTPAAGVDYYSKAQIQKYLVDNMPRVGKDFYTSKEREALIQIVKSWKPKDGKTPVKGKDYFTKKEVSEFTGAIYKTLRDAIKDGKDGKDGTDAKQIEYKWEGTTLYFKKNGKWDKGVNLVGHNGLDGGGGGGIHKIDDATDVNTKGATNGQALVYNSTTKKWEAGTVLSDSLDYAYKTALTVGSSDADYITDGTADEVQINAALAAVKSTGGKVLLKPGTYTCAAPIELIGDTANDVGNPQIILHGSGIDTTKIAMASGNNGIELTDEPKFDIAYMSIAVAGAANGIDQQAGTERGNWQSKIHDIYIESDYSTHTGWAIDMESPFRMVFENVEMNGVANGVNLHCHTESFNPGNLSINRMFIDLWNDASNASAVGLRIAVNATSSTGVMNLVSVNRLDIAGGSNLTSSVGIQIEGSTSSYGDSRHHSFQSLNIEDVKTVIKHIRGRDCTYTDLNYCRVLNGGKIIELDSNSHNNSFENVYVTSADSATYDLITDANSSSNLPNKLIRVDGYQGATVTINATLATNTILEQIDVSGNSPTVDSDITNRNNTRTYQNVLVDDEAYGAGWNASLEVPTKNAVYDKIETLGTGGVTKTWSQKSATYTITTADYGIEGTANTFTITLPTAVGIGGQEFVIKNSGAGTITVDGNASETIDGALTATLSQYDSLIVVSNGSNFIII